MNIWNEFVYHYYEKRYGPLATLSSLPDEQDIKLNRLQIMKMSYKQYRLARKMIEGLLLEQFTAKGGKAKDSNPLYFTIKEQAIIKNWYEEIDYIMIPLKELPKEMISFTYGDSFITFLRGDNHPTRRKLFMANEIERVIHNHGFNIEYNNMPTYIEMQLWDSSVLYKYMA